MLVGGKEALVGKPAAFAPDNRLVGAGNIAAQHRTGAIGLGQQYAAPIVEPGDVGAIGQLPQPPAQIKLQCPRHANRLHRFAKDTVGAGGSCVPILGLFLVSP